MLAIVLVALSEVDVAVVYIMSRETDGIVSWSVAILVRSRFENLRIAICSCMIIFDNYLLYVEKSTHCKYERAAVLEHKHWLFLC